MLNLGVLQRTVQATLASKRLGQPVFVRFHLQSEDKPDVALKRLTEITAAIQEWMGTPLGKMYAVGSLDSGQVALTLEFRDGTTALASWSQGRPRGDGVDLTVIGNHGALYHDAGAGDLWDEPAERPEVAEDPKLQAIIVRALKSRKPEVP